MEFLLAQKTLESLDWQQVVARVLRYCRTPQARRRLGAADTSAPEGLEHSHSAEGNSSQSLADGTPGIRDALARD
ncbi:MAG: hypothetical protein GY733_03810, partial [bacterium]|nr:hypothetical protein [bacterium]